MLDIFRRLTGRCIISPHPLAIGRMSYPKRPGSMHIFKEDIGVRAIDVFPNDDPDDRRCKGSPYAVVEKWIRAAEKIGFTGIGLYPEWTLDNETRIGFHLDLRDEPFQWGYLQGKQVTLDQAFNTLD